MNISGLPIIAVGSSLVSQTKQRGDQNALGTGARSVRIAVANEQTTRLPEERVIIGELLEKRAIFNSQATTNSNARIFEFDLAIKLRQQQSATVASSRKAINAYLSTSDSASLKAGQMNKVDLYA